MTFRTRREFIATLALAGCGLSLWPTLGVRGDVALSAHEDLVRVLSTYGEVTELKQRGNRIEMMVRIRNIQNLPRACSIFSRQGPVYACGSELTFTAGSRHVLIRNRS